MNKKRSNISKYRAIIISIGMFLVFDLGVLIVNFYISKQFSENAQTIDLAGRQATNVQRITKSVFEIKNKVNSDLPYQTNLEELKKSLALFEQTHEAFQNGGTIQGVNNNTIVVEPINDPVGREILTRGDTIWTGFEKFLKPVLKENYYSTREEVGQVSNYAGFYNVWLLQAMNELTLHVRNLAQDKARTLRQIQITGISLAIINFFIILFHFIRQLREKDDAVQSAKRETDKIMETVNEGLFLIDDSGSAGDQQSFSLSEILKTDTTTGFNFFDYLKSNTPQQTLDNAKEYISVLFSKHVKENLVKSLNPLKVVETNIQTPSGEIETQYLSFNFNRVTTSERLNNLLVTVKDITKETMLEKELEQAKESASKQMDLLTSILPLDPKELNEFLDSTLTSLGEINVSLKNFKESSATPYKKLLDDLYRKTHKIKGDAAVIGFRIMEEAAHEFESKLEALKQSPKKIQSNDFIPITIGLEELFQNVETVRELISQLTLMNRFESQGVAAPNDGKVSKWDKLKELSSKIASEYQKKVELHLAGFRAEIPEQHTDKLYPIAVQLIRNSITHGIETPTNRKGSNKVEHGQIMLTLKQPEDSRLELTVHDDGGSFNLEKIKQLALQKSLITREQYEELTDKEAASLIFKPGFSTSSSADLNSGRGVGMDLVLSEIRKLKGKLKINFSEGKHTTFTVSIPTYSV